MRAVWKYEFAVDDEVVVEMCPGKILAVGVQKPRHVCLWVEVDTGAKPLPHRFSVRGTGHPLPEPSGVYVDTAFDGAFVWHVFQRHYSPGT